MASITPEDLPAVRIVIQQLEQRLLLRTLATLRLNAPVFDAIDDLQWRGEARICRTMQ